MKNRPIDGTSGSYAGARLSTKSLAIFTPVSVVNPFAQHELRNPALTADEAARIAKATGNGYPVAGVICRRSIAAAVHGSGRYLGLELVRDRATREPATAQALAICERLRELGVVVQPTGDHLNVLELKPPPVFTSADADRVVEAIADALERGW